VAFGTARVPRNERPVSLDEGGRLRHERHLQQLSHGAGRIGENAGEFVVTNCVPSRKVVVNVTTRSAR
jgi:hypothetical protein